MNLTKYFPLGELIEDRVQLSLKYKLFENKEGIYRLTEKCRKHYDEMSYLKYLKGMREKPVKITDVKPKPQKKKPIKKQVKNDPNEYKDPECQQIINEILSL
jgi:hypothetical protein